MSARMGERPMTTDGLEKAGAYANDRQIINLSVKE